MREYDSNSKGDSHGTANFPSIGTPGNADDVPGAKRRQLSSDVAQDSSWCQLSNTAPSNLQEEQIVVNLDWLEFWVFGDWAINKTRLFEELEKAKLAAKEKRKESFIVQKGISVRVSPFSSSGVGAERCKFQLQYRGIYLGICNNKDLTKSPIAKIELQGQALTVQGLSISLSIANELLEIFGIRYRRSRIKRLDIKADLFEVPISEFANADEENRVITEYRSDDRKRESKDVQTLMYGSRSGASLLRIYDKLAQIKKDEIKSDVFEQFVTGGELLNQCTRVEFELHRAAFRQFELCSFEDCFGRMHDIVDYFTSKKFRIAERQNSKHPEREPMSPLWLRVRNAFLKFAKSFKEQPASKCQKAIR